MRDDRWSGNARPRVLVVHDDADLRQFVVGVLDERYRIEAVSDGASALASALAQTPDLILTGLMSPDLDGVRLVTVLRADPRTSGVPVIMLTDDAGEDTSIEGMERGADDFLVQPFSARELLARVTVHLKVARLRRESDAAIRASADQFQALVSASSDVVYRMNADWTEMRHLEGREFIADTHEPSRSWMEKYIHPDDRRLVAETIHAAVRTKSSFELEHRVVRIDGTLGWTFSRAIPLLDDHGAVIEWLGMASDVTARKQAQDALRDSEHEYRALFESMDEGYCVIEMIFDADSRPTDYRFLQVNPAFEKHTGIRDALGKRIREIAPDLEAHWFEMYGQVAITGEAIRFVNEARDLGSRWFDVYAFRLGGSGSHTVAVLFSDISERKMAEVALKASEDRSRTILDSITDGFFALDRDWRFTYMNAAAGRFLNRTPGDLIGKGLLDEFADLAGSEFERAYRRVDATRVRESFTAHHSTLDRWYEVTAYPATEGLTVYFSDVTDRRKVVHERERFAALVEASPDFIGVAGLDQRGLYVNRAGMAMSGLSADQLATISIRDFFPESEQERILGILAGSENGEPVVVDTHFQHLQTGELIPVSWSFLRLRDAGGNVSGYATVTRDLTERRRHEEITLQSLTAIVERCPYGIYIVDEEFCVASMNAGSQDGAFANVRPVIGRRFDEVMRVLWPEPVAAGVIDVFRHTLATGESYYSRNFVHARADVDHMESYEWEVHRIDMPNGRHGAVCYYFDSTDLREAERRLSEADRKKDAFLATLAHELRNPLAPIRIGVQVMRLTQGDAEASERTWSMMERQVGQMAHLLDDLLDVSRISRGTINLRKERIELTSAIAQAIEISQPFIDRAGHELAVDVPPSPIHVDGDLTRLAQVFSNLLNNAAKYTPRGGHIRLTVQQLGSDAVISVTDDGIGIPTGMLSEIFEMFTHADRNQERSQSGLGIGLSIVRQLVGLHGGSVEARSGGDGLGSEFIVRLPVYVSGEAQEPRDEATSLRATEAHRILVVDDNVDLAQSLATLLAFMGHEIRMAYDGLEALHVAAEFRPTVMLLDIGLPKLDGVEVCRRIKQQALGKDMIVIAMTGWGQEADTRSTLAAGADAHLVKPVAPAALMKVLAELTAARA